LNLWSGQGLEVRGQGLELVVRGQGLEVRGQRLELDILYLYEKSILLPYTLCRCHELMTSSLTNQPVVQLPKHRVPKDGCGPTVAATVNVDFFCFWRGPYGSLFSNTDDTVCSLSTRLTRDYQTGDSTRRRRYPYSLTPHVTWYCLT